MEIPLNARVECSDGVCGQSLYVLIDPLSEEVTHVVVKENTYPHTEYIVPVGEVGETIVDTIQLRLKRAEMEKMEHFVQTEYVEVKVSDREFGYDRGMYPGGSAYYVPHVTHEFPLQMPVERLQVPPGELAVRRGTRVLATDGDVGQVDEFVVNPESGHITSLVLREGHLWGPHDVIIPLSAIGETREDGVLLKLDKRQVGELPTFKLRRRWA